MMPAVAAFGGAALGGLASYYGQQQANESNKEIAEAQMRFQADMSNTAHQREVQDLKAAGLNPLLSANAGASTPAGASATMENAIGAGISTAMQYKQIQDSLATAEKQRELLDSQKKKTDMETRTLKTDAVKGDLTEKAFNLFRNVMNSGGKISTAKPGAPSDQKINDWMYGKAQKSIPVGGKK